MTSLSKHHGIVKRTRPGKHRKTRGRNWWPGFLFLQGLWEIWGKWIESLNEWVDPCFNSCPFWMMSHPACEVQIHSNSQDLLASEVPLTSMLSILGPVMTWIWDTRQRLHKCPVSRSHGKPWHMVAAKVTKSSLVPLLRTVESNSAYKQQRAISDIWGLNTFLLLHLTVVTSS